MPNKKSSKTSKTLSPQSTQSKLPTDYEPIKEIKISRKNAKYCRDMQDP